MMLIMINLLEIDPIDGIVVLEIVFSRINLMLRLSLATKIMLGVTLSIWDLRVSNEGSWVRPDDKFVETISL